MPRKKVQLAWIADDSARRSTFTKRKTSLMKKLEELKTLCGVVACAILYGPDDSTPEAWPDISEAAHILLQFKNSPEEERTKNMANQEDFLRKLANKLEKRVNRRAKETEELEMMVLINEWLSKRYITDMSIHDLTKLASMAGEKLKMVREKIESVERQKAPAVAGLADTNAAGEEIERESSFLEMMMTSCVYYGGNGGDGPYMDGSFLQ